MKIEKEFFLVERRLAENGIICPDPYSLDTKTLQQAAPLLIEMLNEVTTLGVKSALIRVASDGPIPPGRFITELKHSGL